MHPGRIRCKGGDSATHATNGRQRRSGGRPRTPRLRRDLVREQERQPKERPLPGQGKAYSRAKVLDGPPGQARQSKELGCLPARLKEWFFKAGFRHASPTGGGGGGRPG